MHVHVCVNVSLTARSTAPMPRNALQPATPRYDLLFPLPLLMVLPLPVLCPCANACQIAKLMPGATPPDRYAGDECGYAVGLDASTGTLVMGCPGHNRVAQDAGVIVVYLWNGAAWVEHQTVYNERSVKEDRCVHGDEGSMRFSCCCSPLKLAPTVFCFHPSLPGPACGRHRLVIISVLAFYPCCVVVLCWRLQVWVSDRPG